MLIIRCLRHPLGGASSESGSRRSRLRRAELEIRFMPESRFTSASRSADNERCNGSWRSEVESEVYRNRSGARVLRYGSGSEPCGDSHCNQHAPEYVQRETNNLFEL